MKAVFILECNHCSTVLERGWLTVGLRVILSGVVLKCAHCHRRDNRIRLLEN